MIEVTLIPTSTDEGDESCVCVEILADNVAYLGEATRVSEVYASREALHQMLRAGAVLAYEVGRQPEDEDEEQELAVVVFGAKAILAALVYRHLGGGSFPDTDPYTASERLKVFFILQSLAVSRMVAGKPKKTKGAPRTYLVEGRLFVARLVSGVLRIDVPNDVES